MVPLAVDENVDGRVLRGLLRRSPRLDVVRVQDIGLDATDDREILAWAAAEGRLLLSHDVQTMTRFAADRLAAGERMAGLVLLPQVRSVGAVIDAVLQLLEEAEGSPLVGRIVYLKP